ncbi:hypothetical protein [Streptomyces chattanoogensis]|uniref:Uncharacterized protein n=1 Tax=Streptomyces chattanoogensis TaxID=66876 RepID=A0A0N0GZ94_9ACTN|nr:hypothetical protein [Streptomyces chattanoogensis]KPC62549.1 hypothetical protein ADL29_18745 [Streptomyces chattanoogensis]
MIIYTGLKTIGWITPDTSLPNPLEPAAYRRDGRPAYPIRRTSPDDDFTKPGDEGGTPSGGVTQKDLP